MHHVIHDSQHVIMQLLSDSQGPVAINICPPIGKLPNNFPHAVFSGDGKMGTDADMLSFYEPRATQGQPTSNIRINIPPLSE